MEDEQQRKREGLYAETRKDLLARQLSNAEQFDRAVLTLSSGALGLSLAFIKDFVPVDKAQVPVLLVASWIFFGCAIVSTVSSFLVSQVAINIQLNYAEQYYLKREGQYLAKKNIPAKITDALNVASGVLFVIAVGCTIIFVMFNLGGAKMAEGKSGKAQINDAAPIPTLQSAPGSGVEKKGAPIPSMPVVPGGGQSGGNQSGQSSPGKK